MAFFQEQVATLDEKRLRAPQIQGFQHVAAHYAVTGGDREVALVLPVGCGKSGLIALLPFSVRARRALVIAPNLRLKGQLSDELNPSDRARNFLHAYGVVPPHVGWERVVLDANASKADLADADVVVANIQQVAGDENRWLEAVEDDFFDLIVFDEAHHNVAASWERLRAKFHKAKIVNLSATPLRADGQKMTGEIIYSYSIREAMERGYIRQLRAVRVNPRELSYVEGDGHDERQISLEEIRKLGESDAKFRRTILQSEQSLSTIVDASVLRLREIRKRTGNDRHKIIAAALNEKHCRQVVAAFKMRDLRVDYVHANRGEDENDRVIAELERNEIDVIVQVRMLGEGFDHRYLSVAAVCNVYGSLTPFLQFVGRVMRLAPDAPDEEGVVVFHSGSNVASLWDDLRLYSEADREYFEQLLPLDEAFGDENEHEENPLRSRAVAGTVTKQGISDLEDIPLLANDQEFQRAVDALADSGVGPEVLERMRAAGSEELHEIFVTSQNRRKADRERLHKTIPVAVTEALGRRGLAPKRMSPKPPDTNLVLGIKRANDAISAFVGREGDTRREWTNEELKRAFDNLDEVVDRAMAETFDAR